MLPIPRLWLLTVVPVAIAIMPIGKLTLWLVLVLAVDVAVALLLARDFCAYRPANAGEGIAPLIRGRPPRE
jgi:hypothetical protein